MHLGFRPHLTAIFHSVMRFWRTVVKCPEPLVPWHFEIAVIHLKVPMMHLVMKRAQRKGFAILDQQRFIPRGVRLQPSKTDAAYETGYVRDVPE